MHFPAIYVLPIHLIFSALLIPNCLSLLSSQNQTAASPRSSPRPLDESSINNTHPTVPLPSHAAYSAPETATVSASSKFNPSMAIIIFVLLAAFFLMGIFSLYIRRCTSVDDELRRRSMNSNLFVRSALRRQQTSESGGSLHGVDLLLVSSLPTMKFSKAKGLDAEKGERIVGECVVCLSEFEDGEELRFLPKCGHSFHLDCIDMWLFSHTTCPLCRTLLCEGKNNEHLNRDVHHEPLSLLLLT